MCPFSRTSISINRQVKPNAEKYNVTANNFLQFQLLRNANFISSFTFFVLPLSSDHFKKLQIDLAISLLLEPYQGQGHEKAYMIALPRYRPIQRALKYMERKVQVYQQLFLILKGKYGPEFVLLIKVRSTRKAIPNSWKRHRKAEW